MKVGVIFLSLGGTSKLRMMTQNAVNSCIASDPEIDFKILVCEGERNVKYNNAHMSYSFGNFNYNRTMNECRKHHLFDDCDYIALCNNDLLFEKGWATALIEAMKEQGVMSACPMEPRVHKEVKFTDGIHEGHEVTSGYRPVAGWCIFQDLRIYNVIKDLDECVEFWHSDTVYGSQLAKHKVKHILVEGSKVHHLTSQTIDRLPEHIRNPLTVDSPLHKLLYPNGNIS